MRRILGCVLFGVIGASVWAQTPQVLDSIPCNGDLLVNPELTWLAFTFDCDMSASYSLCTYSGNTAAFPKILSVKWVDSRLFAVRVQLEPGHDYQFTLNSATYQNFRDAQGHPLATYLVVFRTSGAAPDLTPQINTKAVQELRRCIDEEYSYRDLRGVDWSSLFAQYTTALTGATTATQFAQITATMLGAAKDLHITVAANGQTLATFTPNVTPNANAGLLPQLVPGFTQQNSTVSTGRFADGIGYVLITTFSQSAEAHLAQVYPMLWDAASVAGLIVDVRFNSGGSEALARQIAGCFVNESHVYAKDVLRSTQYPGGFSPVYDRVLSPNKERPSYRGPVIVLMGPFCVSSCESFLLMMKQAPGGTLMGEKSYGASGNPVAHDLGNGVTVFLPSWKDLRPDGTCFETEGISPDIEVHATKEQLAVSDPLLDAALARLRGSGR
jgi:hypothetical protein